MEHKSLRLKEDTIQKIGLMADIQRRSWNAMARMLLEDAVEKTDI